MDCGDVADIEGHAGGGSVFFGNGIEVCVDVAPPPVRILLPVV